MADLPPPRLPAPQHWNETQSLTKKNIIDTKKWPQSFQTNFKEKNVNPENKRLSCFNWFSSEHLNPLNSCLKVAVSRDFLAFSNLINPTHLDP